MKKYYQAAFAMTLAASAIIAVAPTQANAQFNDVPVGTPQAQAIENLVNLQITGGVSAYQFAPKKAVTRAEAANFIVKALQLDIANAPQTTFKDTQKHWAKSAIAKMTELKIMGGYSDTQFGPDDTLTRGQMAKILANAFELKSTGQANPFKDVAKGSALEPYILAVYENGIAAGLTKDTYGVKDPVTREQMAMFLNRTPLIKERVAEYNKAHPASEKAYAFKAATMDEYRAFIKANKIANVMVTSSSTMTMTANGMTNFPGITATRDKITVTKPGIYYLDARDWNDNNTWLSIRVDARKDVKNPVISLINQQVVDDIIQKNLTLAEFTKRSEKLFKAAGTTRTIRYAVDEMQDYTVLGASSPARRDFFEFYKDEPYEFVVTGKFESYFNNSEYYVLTPNSRTNLMSFDMEVYTPVIDYGKNDFSGIDEMKVIKGDPKLFKFYRQNNFHAPVFALEGATIEEGTTIELISSDSQNMTYVYSNGKFERVVDTEEENL